jgi:hypothetical protein
MARTSPKLSRSFHCGIPTIILSGELANAELPWLPGVPVLPLSKPAEPELLLRSVRLFVQFQRETRLPSARLTA